MRGGFRDLMVTSKEFLMVEDTWLVFASLLKEQGGSYAKEKGLR